MIQHLNVQHKNAYGEIEHNKTYRIKITANDGKPLQQWEFPYVIEQMNAILNMNSETPEHK